MNRTTCFEATVAAVIDLAARPSVSFGLRTIRTKVSDRSQVQVSASVEFANEVACRFFT